MVTDTLAAAGQLVTPTMRPEEGLYEIVDGVRVELPEMSALSTQIATRLCSRLDQFAEQHRLGTVVSEGLFVLDAECNLRRRPDAAFVSAERWPLDREVPWASDWEVVPDLAVEVTSPSDLYDDVMGKIQEYFVHSVREVWIVWPPYKQVHVFRSPEQVQVLTENHQLDGGEILPGFSLPVRELFLRVPKVRSAAE